MTHTITGAGVCILATLPLTASAVNVKGHDGYALVAVFFIIATPVLIYFFANWIRKRGTRETAGTYRLHKSKYSVTLEKNKIYHPDFLKLTVSNNGNSDLDLDMPLLTFTHLFLKRKFRLKGFRNYQFYPLLLEPGKKHELTIDLAPFYQHDPSLKRFPRVTVSVSEVSSNRSVSQSVSLRKTFFN